MQGHTANRCDPSSRGLSPESPRYLSYATSNQTGSCPSGDIPSKSTILPYDVEGYKWHVKCQGHLARAQPTWGCVSEVRGLSGKEGERAFPGGWRGGSDPAR